MESLKLTFNLQELPDGESHREVRLEKDELSLGEGMVFSGADVAISFYKTNHFLEIKFQVDAQTELTCDRSLQRFEKNIDGSYHILFEPNPVEESETEKGAVRQIPHGDLKIDITEEVRDTILLNIPVKKIHPQYIDEEGYIKDFETEQFGPEMKDSDDNIDPRWAELKKLK